MVSPFIANTDERWFRFLTERSRATDGVLDEANFWQPEAKRPMKRMDPGTPVFLRLKRPHYALAGYGFFSSFARFSIQDAWNTFGTKNGAASFGDFVRLLAGYRKTTPEALARDPGQLLSCTVLRDVHFWPQERWMPWGEAQGFARNVVQGKTETDPDRASLLLAEIQYDATLPEELRPEPFHPLDVDERELVLVQDRPRRGQGAFRARLLAAYGGSCAITGEHTEIVLDAAHVQPYLGPRSNHVQNGLLLTKEFHALFDRGYVTVTPDYEVRVSPRLREDWNNGKRYLAADGRPLAALPDDPALRPSPEVLEWHRDRVFLG